MNELVDKCSYENIGLLVTRKFAIST